MDNTPGGVTDQVSLHPSGMDELFVLMDEHAAMRAILAALRPSKGKDMHTGQTLDLLLRLHHLSTSIHGPKEERVAWSRLQEHHAHEFTLLGTLTAQRAWAKEMLDHALEVLSHPGARDGAGARPLVDAVVHAVGQLLQTEEFMIYPALYHGSSEDERWSMAVELDRAVDEGGRQERADLISWCQVLAQPSLESVCG